MGGCELTWDIGGWDVTSPGTEGGGVGGCDLTWDRGGGGCDLTWDRGGGGRM